MFTSLIDQDPHSKELRRTQAKRPFLLVHDDARLYEQGGSYADRFFLASVQSLTIHFLETAFQHDLLDRDEFDFTRPENITWEKFQQLLEVAGELELGDFITPDDFAGGEYIELEQAEAELRAFPDKLEQLIDAVYELRAGEIPDAPVIKFEDGYTVQYLPNIGNGYIDGDVVIEKKIRRIVQPATLSAELGGQKKVAMLLLRGLATIVQTTDFGDDQRTRSQCRELIEQIQSRLGFDPAEPEFSNLIYQLKDDLNSSQLIHRLIRFRVMVENMTTATIGWLNNLVKELHYNEDAQLLLAVLGRALVERLVERENFAGGMDNVVIWEHTSGQPVEYTNDFITQMLTLVDQDEGLKIAILLTVLHEDMRSTIHQGVKREFAGDVSRQIWAEFVNEKLNFDFDLEENEEEQS